MAVVVDFLFPSVAKQGKLQDVSTEAQGRHLLQNPFMWAELGRLGRLAQLGGQDVKELVDGLHGKVLGLRGLWLGSRELAEALL